jgi:hypothetical protein
MKKLFIETSEFTAKASRFLDDDNYRELQVLLMSAPDAGKVIPGCGGMRKIRLGDPRRQKGRRGGMRILYLHVPEHDWIFLIELYDKGERDDLNPKQKKSLRQIAEKCKAM